MTEPERNLQADLRDVIERRIEAHPRSQQTAIGMSEYGTPCTRKLGYKLAGVPRVRAEAPAWRPTVGTAVHSWLEAAFRADNATLGWDRWLTEIKVTAGTIGGRDLRGTCDLYDHLTLTVVDWKIPGVTTIKKARSAKSPGETYRVQAHTYGLGYMVLGLPVENVAVYMLPASGELADGYFWTEPFDPVIADKAIKRADGLAAGIAAAGAEAIIPQLEMVEDFCTHCPWWQPKSTDPAKACPGKVAPRKEPTGPVFGRA